VFQDIYQQSEAHAELQQGVGHKVILRGDGNGPLRQYLPCIDPGIHLVDGNPGPLGPSFNQGAIGPMHPPVAMGDAGMEIDGGAGYAIKDFFGDDTGSGRNDEGGIFFLQNLHHPGRIQ
jgi:hypothetical protein